MKNGGMRRYWEAIAWGLVILTSAAFLFSWKMALIGAAMFAVAAVIVFPFYWRRRND
jgi:hypothetical protein